MPRFAAIDMGSNASRLRIVEADAPGALREVTSLRVPVRLGHSVFLTGKLDPRVIDHAVAALRAADSLESDLGREIDGDFVRELGRVSRRMGRAVALNEVGARLRSIIPLVRSLGPGVPVPGSVRPGY